MINIGTEIEAHNIVSGMIIDTCHGRIAVENVQSNGYGAIIVTQDPTGRYGWKGLGLFEKVTVAGHFNPEKYIEVTAIEIR